MNEAQVRRRAHAWVSAVIDGALLNGGEDNLGTDDPEDYQRVRQQIEVLSARHHRLSTARADEPGLQDLHQAMERLRRAHVGRVPTFRDISRAVGKGYTTVHEAFHIRRAAWQTFADIIRALGADPAHFRELWDKAGRQP